MATSSGRLIAGSTVSMSSIKRRNANPPQSISLICRNQIQGAPPLVLLRPSQRSRPWPIEAVPSAKFWDGSDDFEVAKEEKRKPDASPGGKTDDHALAGKHGRTTEIVIAAAVTAALGVGNRVMYKLALIPLKQYPFFLAQLSTFGYVAVYFSILYFRYRAGIVTKEMLSVPKIPFLIVGILESLALTSGMAAAANLSGPSTTVLSQWIRGRSFI